MIAPKRQECPRNTRDARQTQLDSIRAALSHTIGPRPDNLTHLFPSQLCEADAVHHRVFPFLVRRWPERGIDDRLPLLALRADYPRGLQEGPPRPFGSRCAAR